MTTGGQLALARLLRLASPALPVGAFGYSQGLETAIQSGWVRDEASLQAWVLDVLAFNLSGYEAVMLGRLHRAWRAHEMAGVAELNAQVVAARETAELRAESVQMGSSLRTLFESTGEFDVRQMADLRSLATPSFATVFAFAAARWDIAESDAVLGYLFAWAENQIAAAMKSMRLGHVAGQRILGAVARELPAIVARTIGLIAMSGYTRDPGHGLSNFAPALAIASSRHEMQDSRVFRS